MRRAGEEGYAPSTPERRRLAAIAAAAALLGGWFLAGIAVAAPLAVAGPALAAWAVSSRRRRFRRAVERALPEVAAAVADSLGAGRSMRASLPAAALSVDGPAAVELCRLGAELDLGAPTAAAVEAWRRRMRSARVDAFVAALLSQRRAGGDLAGLLRRFAAGAAERDRAAEEAKSATAQARFTGLLVVAMPSGGALFAELIQPGFLVKVLSAPASADPARPRRGAAGDRLRRDPSLRPGGRVRLGRVRRGRPPLTARLACAAGGAAAALLAAPAAPGRLAWLVAAGLPAAGFVLPDALLERRARRRHRRLLAALPDALDLLAIGSAAGRGPAAGFAELAAAGNGPLADELRIAVAELECGQPLAAALSGLRERVPGGEIATLCAAIERSRRLGSPLADQLRRQASALRRDQRRALEERAARAAPKIQLVVALILVPSVLLMIAAALLANADILLSGF